MAASRLVPAYVALGSNLDDPRARVEQAFEALDALPGTRGVLRSSLYRSPPLGPVEQPEFVNAVAGLLTSLERTQPVVRWGPRRIDLDLLVHGAARVSTEALTLPHPGIAGRAFVLLPLAEIAPDLEVPGLGRVRRLLERVDAAGVERLAA